MSGIPDLIKNNESWAGSVTSDDPSFFTELAKK